MSRVVLRIFAGALAPLLTTASVVRRKTVSKRPDSYFEDSFFEGPRKGVRRWWGQWECEDPCQSR